MASEGGIPPTPSFKLSSLVFTVYIPTILFSIGQGAVIPIIPLFARELGSSVAAASLIVALRGFGQLAFDMPAGLAVSKWGDRGAMIVGTALVATVAVGAAFSPSPIVLGILIFFMGGGWAFWQIARLAYVSEVAPVHQRGRALSMLGGMNRVGNFMGPAIGGLLGQHLGLESAFILQAGLGLAAAGTMFLVHTERVSSEDISTHGLGGRLAETFTENRDVFVRSSFPMFSLAVVRQARQVFLPLWGEHIGLSIAQIGLLTSVSFFSDAAVFYPIGSIMDRFGRKWAGVPCLMTIGAALLVLPITQDFVSFMAVAVLSGVGNGFGTGINMTLGADFAPPDKRGEFLGLWRLMSDIGQAGGPLVISILTGVASLGAASLVSGGVGVLGAVIMMFAMPETLQRHKAAIEAAVTPAAANESENST